MFFRILFSLSIPFAFLHPAIPLFDPPSDWECAAPGNLSSCIQIGYLGKGKSSFRPSINLAIEEIDVDLKEYIKAVKKIHLAVKGTTWRDLGKFKTRSGEGRLTEIGTTSPLGPVKMLQMIVVANNTAYILTGAAIKEEFLRFQETFSKTFQSFQLADDLFSLLTAPQKDQFEAFFSKLGESAADETERSAKWSDLQKLVLTEASEMGNYWQILVLKSGHEKIYR